MATIKTHVENYVYQQKVDEIMKIQQEQMIGWEKVLNEEAYADLKLWVDRKNEEHLLQKRDPYAIVRGTDLQSFISNLQLHLIGMNPNHPLTWM